MVFAMALRVLMLMNAAFCVAAQLSSPSGDVWSALASRPTKNLCASSSFSCRNVTEAVNESAFAALVESRMPFVAADLSDRTLNASLWNLWELASGPWPILQDVLEMQVASDRTAPGVFAINDAQEEDGFFIDFPSYNTIDEMLFAQFLSDVSNATLCRFYSTNFRVLEGIAGLENQTRWQKHRVRDSKVAEDISTAIAPLFNLLYPGCALQARSSDYHTTRVQLQGSARYYLFSPDQVGRGLTLFPSLHPAAQQSQINFYEWNGDDEAAAQKRFQAQVVELTSGQALFIPAGWVVHTEAQTLSTTLDILSASVEQVAILEALSIELPFSKNLSLAQRIIHGQVFLVHVLSRVQGVSTIRQYSQKLYKSRYEALYPADSLVVRNHKFQCYRDQPDVHNHEVNRMDKNKVIAAADAVAQRINVLARHSPAAKWMFLGNYVENVIGWIWQGGSLLNVAMFLRECLDMRSKIEVVVEVEGPSVVTLDPIY